MNSRSKRILGRIFTGLLVLYFAGGVILYFTQDLIIFHPTPLPPDHRFSFEQPFTEVNIPYEGGNLNMVQFNPEGKRKGIVLFFHGNMNNVEHYAKYPSLFLQNGFAVWMIDYPGFGKSTGKRSEKVLYRLASLMYTKAIGEIKADSIIIYGKSVGTGIASYLASVRKCRQVVLETPYYSMNALARHYFPVYPVIPMLKYSLPVNKYLAALNIPVTIFHGTSDEVVPYKQSTWLVKENPAINLVTIEKGKHNDLFSFKIYQQKMDSLLRETNHRP